MAIRIPILTSFDPKGLKQANAQFAKLQTSMSSLGRNFVAAGVVIAGAMAMISRSVADAAESQKVFAQTEAVLKSMGTTANGTATDLANMASALQKTTAFSDEAILAGTNLLLTFKNIQNQAGAGNDIFSQTATLMLDVARAMGTSASGEAIRLGKALNDPVKGISALTRVGIQFTEQQKAQIKALAESGDLMGAQKIILAELQAQFGGSAAAYAQTFAGQVEGMNNQLNDLSEEIGFMVMPALTSMVAELQALIPVIGPQLKAAIESVDWKALTGAVVGLTTFLIENADTILKVVAAVFALNTAFKLMAVASGVAQTAIALQTWVVAQMATGLSLAAVALKVFRTALITTGVGAVVVGLGFLIEALINSNNEATKAVPAFDAYGTAVRKTGTDADWAATRYGIATTAAKNYGAAVSAIKTPALDMTGYAEGFRARIERQRATVPGAIVPEVTATTGGGGSANRDSVSSVLKRERILSTREAKLLNVGASEAFADLIVSTATTKKAFQKELAKISTPKGLERRQARFNKTAAGQAEIAQNTADAAQAATEAAAEMASAQEAIARATQEATDREAAALAERERIYGSFLDSVKNTFGNIKNAILGAFDITQLGGSTNSITRNMDKMLVKLRSFATNVAKLSGLGLNSALLQQVISAGPMAGAKLAESLVMGGAEGLAAINAGYSEFGNLAGQIATTGTNSMFGTEAQQNVYNIEVNGGVGSGATIGKAIVDAIKAYERTSGAVWQGA